jgi:hypothetical protein
VGIAYSLARTTLETTAPRHPYKSPALSSRTYPRARARGSRSADVKLEAGEAADSDFHFPISKFPFENRNLRKTLQQ